MELAKTICGPTSGPPALTLANVCTPEHGSTNPVELDFEDLFCILQIEPNDSLIALELARQLEAAGRLEETARVLRGVVRIDSRFETLFALGRAEYACDDFDDAFINLQNALRLAGEPDATHFELHKTLGNIFVRRGDLDAAEDAYNRAHRLNPESDALHVNLGTLSIQRADWDQALDRFRFALALNQNNAKAWVGLSLGHRMKGDLELAWGNLEAALENDPRNETALALALDWGAREGREFRVLELIRAYLVAGGWSERFSLAFASLAHRHGESFVARLELVRLLAVNPLNDAAAELLNEVGL